MKSVFHPDPYLIKFEMIANDNIRTKIWPVFIYHKTQFDMLNSKKMFSSRLEYDLIVLPTFADPFC